MDEAKKKEPMPSLWAHADVPEDTGNPTPGFTDSVDLWRRYEHAFEPGPPEDSRLD